MSQDARRFIICSKCNADLNGTPCAFPDFGYRDCAHPVMSKLVSVMRGMQSGLPGAVLLWCPHCDEAIKQGDDLARHLVGSESGPRLWHEECAFRSVAGGLNHLQGKCTCCAGGTLPPDPPGLTKREAAKAAYEYRSKNPQEPHA